jgi:hypothetical protein
MKSTLTYDQTTITLNTGTIQTRNVKTPELVYNRLLMMNILYLKPIHARRIFEHVVPFFDGQENKITTQSDSLTIETNLGKITYKVKNPLFIASRVKALHIEQLSPSSANTLFERACCFYDCRAREKLYLVLQEGQTVRHSFKIKKNTFERDSTYKDGVLVWQDKHYTSLNQFVSAHYKDKHPTRTTSNAWTECKTLLNNEWVNLRHSYLKG